MLPKQDYILAQLLGPDTPQVQALIAAASVSEMSDAVHLMLRNLAQQEGWDPDDLPRFVLPRDIPSSDHILGVAMSGDVASEEVGLSEIDLRSHVGLFGLTDSGKTTVAKIILLSFTGKIGAKVNQNR